MKSQKTDGKAKSSGTKSTSNKPAKKWSPKVTTDSTHPREDLFNQDAESIARELASKEVSPKGPASGMRMLTFYINRAGKNLTPERKQVLEHAKKLLHARVESARSASTA